MEKKKISLSMFISVLAVLVIIIMAGFIYMQKINSDREISGLKNDAVELKETVTELQERLESMPNTTTSQENDENNFDSKKNTSTENKVSAKTNTANTNSTVSSNSTGTQNVKYEFVSADNAAMRGNGRNLKIYNITESKLDFKYENGINFETSTLDREVKGTATTNGNKKYEFEENVSGHKYKITFEFSENMDEVKVTEFDNGNEKGWINLFSN